MNEQSLRKHAEDFIRYKRSLGYIYDGQAHILNRYVTFAEMVDSSPIPTKTTVNGFIDSLSDAHGTLYQAVSALREFSRYLYSCGYTNAYMIPPKTAFQPTPEEPYFFTEKEISYFF